MAAPFTGTVWAASYGGGWPWGHPALLCVHDVEAPLANGYAYSLAGYFARPQSSGGPGTSAHAIAGPDGLWQMVPAGNVSWNCGPNGNGITFAIEQCGYAIFNRTQWTTSLGMQQLERVAQWLAWAARLHSIPLRWASYAEIRLAYNNGGRVGVCTHDDITNAIGGTNHWDPGTSYPKDLLMRRAIEIYNGIVIPKGWDELATKAEVQSAASAGANAAVTALIPQIETIVNDRAASASFWAIHALITGTVHGHSFLTKPPFSTEPYLVSLLKAMVDHSIVDVEKAIAAINDPPPVPLPIWQNINLNADQMGNAQIVVATAKKLGLTPRDAAIAVQTAMTESSLKSGDVLPNDGTTSIGLFQQKKEYYPDIDRSDPVQSTTAFLNQLKGIIGRETIPMHVCSQTIQRSQFDTGINYAVWTELGVLLAETLWNN